MGGRVPSRWKIIYCDILCVSIDVRRYKRYLIVFVYIIFFREFFFIVLVSTDDFIILFMTLWHWHFRHIKIYIEIVYFNIIYIYMGIYIISARCRCQSVGWCMMEKQGVLLNIVTQRSDAWGDDKWWNKEVARSQHLASICEDMG